MQITIHCRLYSGRSTVIFWLNTGGFHTPSPRLTWVRRPLESTINTLSMASCLLVPSSSMAITSRLAIPIEACQIVHATCKPFNIHTHTFCLFFFISATLEHRGIILVLKKRGFRHLSNVDQLWKDKWINCKKWKLKSD